MTPISARAMDVACTHCGAPAGSPCMGQRGRMAESHFVRRQAVRMTPAAPQFCPGHWQQITNRLLPMCAACGLQQAQLDRHTATWIAVEPAAQRAADGTWSCPNKVSPS